MSSYHAALEDLAAKRRGLAEVIVALAGVAGVDPAPYLGVPALVTVDVSQPGGTLSKELPKKRAKKGTKRAAGPTTAASDHETRILAALKNVGEPVAPGVLAKWVDLSLPTLRYQLKKLEDRKLVTVSGVTAGRRVQLP